MESNGSYISRFKLVVLRHSVEMKSSFYIPSIHCPTCAQYIESTISKFALQSVSLDYQSKIISFDLPRSRVSTESIKSFREVLAQNGYPSSEVKPTSTESQRRNTFARLFDFFNVPRHQRKKRHIDHCIACQSGLTHEKGSDIESRLTSQSGEETTSILRKAQFAVGGMTCTSCSGTLTSSLENVEGIVSADVHIITHSAVVVYRSDFISTDRMIEVIEDTGFEGRLVEDGLLEKDDKQDAKGVRTLEVEIKGYDYTSLPSLNARLNHLGLISFTPITTENSISTIVYRPSKDLSIRDILDFSEPIQASIHHRPSMHALMQENLRREAKMLSFLLLVSFAIAIPTFVIGVVGMSLLPKSHPFRIWSEETIWGGCQRVVIALFVLSTVSQVAVNQYFIVKAWKAVVASSRSWRWSQLVHFGNMDLLVALSTSVAYFASLGLLIRDVCRSPELTMQDGTSTYFDSSVFLGFFILMGRVLEGYARSKTNDAIAMLEDVSPEHALLLSNLSEKDNNLDAIHLLSDPVAKIPADLIEVGDLLLLPPGAMPAGDGFIVAGSSTFDESSLTGESLPVSKCNGDGIMTGTTNLSSPIVFRVETVGDETMMRKIVRAVAEGQAKKSPIQVLADKITSVFVPVIIYASLIVLIVWLSIFLSAADSSSIFPGGRNKTSDRIAAAFEFAIAVLVIACPCGIGLAAPTAQAVGSGLSAKAGIIAQGGGEAFQFAGNTDIVVFDKTGTLTKGEASVSQSHLEKDEDTWLWEAVKMAEATSTHPLAAAIVSHCNQRQIPSSLSLDMLECEEVSGRGVRATFLVDGAQVKLSIGNEDFVSYEDARYTIPDSLKDTVDTWRDQGQTVVFVFSADTSGPMIALIFGIADQVREGFVQAIASLQASGKDVYMLTGDNERTARSVARQLGLDSDHVKAGALPTEKAQFVTGLRQQRREKHLSILGGWSWRRKERNAIVAFAGDGLNDSAALAAADIGVAMSHGSQVSIASAAFILLSDRSIPQVMLQLFQISSKVHKRQIMNFGWAMFYNVALIPVAAGVLYPYHETRLSPVWSALAMALSSVSVVVSSLALQWGL